MNRFYGILRTKTLLSTTMSAQNQPTESSAMPKDANTIIAILKDMGVTEYEPKVINQMLEFTYRYITDVLEDAKTYSSHAGRTNINLNDVKLSVQTQLDHSFVSPPPRSFLAEVARQKNTAALPPIKNFSGARLPPDRFCLSAVNYRLKPTVDKKPSVRKSVGTNRPAPSLVSSSTPQKHQFINPQIIMPTGSATKRKWHEEDDYDT